MSSFSISYRKLKLLFEFYKSFAIYPIGFSLVVYNTPFVGGLGQALLLGTFIGFLLFLFLKEFNKYNDSYYYLNNSLSKLKLYSFCLLVNLIISLILLVLSR